MIHRNPMGTHPLLMCHSCCLQNHRHPYHGIDLDCMGIDLGQHHLERSEKLRNNQVLSYLHNHHHQSQTLVSNFYRIHLHCTMIVYCLTIHLGPYLCIHICQSMIGHSRQDNHRLHPGNRRCQSLGNQLRSLWMGRRMMGNNQNMDHLGYHLLHPHRYLATDYRFQAVDRLHRTQDLCQYHGRNEVSLHPCLHCQIM